jgi:hypothetical protein
MHYDWKIEYWDTENVYTHTWMAYLLFDNCHVRHCHLVAQVALRVEAACWAEVPLVVVEVCQFLYTSSMSADSSLCHFGKECSRLFDFYTALPGVFLSQPSPLYAQEAQNLTFSPLGLWDKDSQ